MPTAAMVMAEKTPRMTIVFVLHQNPYPSTARPVANVLARGHVFFPDDAEKQRTGAVHDGDIRELPVFVVRLQGLNHQEEEGVGGDGAHGVIGDTRGRSATHPSGIGKKRVEPTLAALSKNQLSRRGFEDTERWWGGDSRKAHIVQIEVDATIMCQDEVADGVCSLDGLRVVVKGVEEPGVLGGNQLA